jgi:hypothetical protein
MAMHSPAWQKRFVICGPVPVVNRGNSGRTPSAIREGCPWHSTDPNIGLPAGILERRIPGGVQIAQSSDVDLGKLSLFPPANWQIPLQPTRFHWRGAPGPIAAVRFSSSVQQQMQQFASMLRDA